MCTRRTRMLCALNTGTGTTNCCGRLYTDVARFPKQYSRERQRKGGLFKRTFSEHTTEASCCFAAVNFKKKKKRYCFCAVDTRYGDRDIVHTGADVYTRMVRVPRVLCTKIEDGVKDVNGWNGSPPQDSETVITATQKKKKTWQCMCVWRARSMKTKSKTSERERERAFTAAPSSVNSNQ